jgi:hypothetical protein
MGVQGHLGDGGAATSAELGFPTGVAVDANGNLFIADPLNSVVCMVSASTKIITRYAGIMGNDGSAGDGGAAKNANLGTPYGLAVGRNGDLFIADSHNMAVRKVTASTGIITTYAGTLGSSGQNGDGQAATSAGLNVPWDVALNADGDLFIADRDNAVVRIVTASTGIITTYAGQILIWGYTGDGGEATSAKLSRPYGVAVNANGDLFISDQSNYAIRKVTMIHSPTVHPTVRPSQPTGQPTMQPSQPSGQPTSRPTQVLACSSGMYSTSPTLMTCFQCAAGSYSLRGATTCITCNAGFTSGPGASVCIPCPIGYYSVSPGGSCYQCAAGSYTSSSGASVCTSCPSKQFSNPGASACTSCSA